jgi:hypothetical protein
MEHVHPAYNPFFQLVFSVRTVFFNRLISPTGRGHGMAGADALHGVMVMMARHSFISFAMMMLGSGHPPPNL